MELWLFVIEQLVKVVCWHCIDVGITCSHKCMRRKGGGDCFCNAVKCTSPAVCLFVPPRVLGSVGGSFHKIRLLYTHYLCEEITATRCFGGTNESTYTKCAICRACFMGRRVQELIFQVQSQKWLTQVKKQKSYLPITANIPVCTNYLCFLVLLWSRVLLKKAKGGR